MKHSHISVIEIATNPASSCENINIATTETSNLDLNSANRNTVASMSDKELNTSKGATSEGLIVIRGSDDIITNPRHTGKQSKLGAASRKKRIEQQDTFNKLSTAAAFPTSSNPNYNPKTDCYSPKRTK